MPNWASGTVEAKGTLKALLAFSMRFIAADDVSENCNERYFAGSHINHKRAYVENEIQRNFKDVSTEEVQSYRFNVEFAWSAYECIIDVDTESNSENCITLPEACALDKVDVIITTREIDMCFEETIYCTQNGKLTVERKEIQ